MDFTITSSVAGDNLTDATLAAAGLDGCTINLVNQAQDTCHLLQIPATWTGTPIITQGATVTIKEDSVPVFVGRCLSDPRNATGLAHTIAYEIAGPWYWLDQVEYRQRHQRWTGASLQWVTLPAVTLNQAENGTSIASGAQVSAAIDYAIAQGAPIAKGTIAAGITLPWESANSISCADVIRRMLAWTPDNVLWINYAPASGHPQINVTPRASMPTASVALSAYTTTKAAVCPRYDLQLPGVEIIFNITQDNNGQTYMAVQTETAGTHTDSRALRAVIELAGSTSSSAQFQEIVTSDFPVTGDPPEQDWLDKAWWKARNPSLVAYADADMDLHDPVIEVEKDSDGNPLYSIGDLPRVLEEGSVTPWMVAGGVKAAAVTITVKLDAIERDAIGQIVRKVVDRTLTLRVTATNGLARRYSRSEFSEYSEEIPTGIAAAVYASLSPLTYEGDLTLVAPESPAGYRPGQALAITGGRAEWATMAAVIQTVTRNIADGSTAITFGPAAHLGINDLARLGRRIRQRKVPFSYIPRQTGLAGDAAALAGGRAPRNDAAAEAGKPVFARYELPYDPDNPPVYTSAIEIDPDAITKPNEEDPEPVLIKPRTIQTVERIDGELVRVTRSYLVSDSISTPVVIDPDEPGGGGPEDPEDCDQNQHPGNPDNPDPGDPDDPDPDHPGNPDPEDPDPDHPGVGECYTTT